MVFVESVGSKVLAGTIVEIIKRTGMKFLEKDKTFDLLQEIEARISSTLLENECSGLHSYMKLSSTINYIHNYIRLLPFKDFNKTQTNEYVTSSEFIGILTLEAIDHIRLGQYNIPVQRTIENFFADLLAVIEENLVMEIPGELAIIPYIITKNVEQMIRAFRESSAASSNMIPNYEEKRQEYLNNVKHVFAKNHVPGVDILDFDDYYIYPQFIYFNQGHDSEHFHNYSDHDKRETIEWTDIFLRSNLISIVGGPGYGKTLFLKNLVVNSDKLNINNPEKYLPIYCNLKDFTEKKKNFKGFSFKDFLIESMIDYTGVDIGSDMLTYFLARGECLIFLDALDEVDSLERQKFSNLIISFYKNSNNNNKLCITTRDRSLIPETPIVLKVKPIEEDDVIEYLKLMVRIEEFREIDINHFIQQTRHLIDKKFLANFLTVALMVKIYKADRKIPDNKIELFDKCVNYTAKERERDKNVGFDFEKMGSIINNDVTFEKLADLSKRNNREVSRSTIIENLSDVFRGAYRDKNDASNAIEHFLNFCKDRTELYIQGMKEDHFKFFHRSFFEFFYAKHMVKNINGSVSLFNELYKFSSDSELHELLISYLKNYNYNKYQKLIDVVIDKFEKSSDSRTTQLALDFVELSDEFSHKEKLYNLLFEKDKLREIRMLTAPVSNLNKILDSMTIFEDFIEKLIEKYSDELLQAMVLVVLHWHTDNNLYNYQQSDQIVRSIWFSDTLMSKRNEKIVNFVNGLSFDTFIIKAGVIERMEFDESHELKFHQLDNDEMYSIYEKIKLGKFYNEEVDKIFE
ncbi:NACHT domain-containing protein [Paenibacillus sp. YAF4_2]|uniref:NACHT domain-containing protein n=1 Tax=Paenibacillus sp. YAF4_2 TaxID=3233085 RepID=UPI003F9695B5